MEATPGGRLGTFGTLPGLNGNDSWLVDFAKCFFKEYKTSIVYKVKHIKYQQVKVD